MICPDRSSSELLKPQIFIIKCDINIIIREIDFLLPCQSVICNIKSPVARDLWSKTIQVRGR